MIDNKLISVVSTVYNSEIIIPEFIFQVEKVLSNISSNYEIILVEDCGTDNSWNVIEQICSQNNKIKGVRLSRNFGQQIAMSAGVQKAKGHFVIIMDGDLQNPPSAIKQIIKKLIEGNDIVYTKSNERNNIKDKLSSKLFWFFLIKILNVNIVENQLMMKGMTQNFVQQFGNYLEINRTISGITNDIGMKYKTIEIENKKRYSGKSNYNFMSRFNLMIDVVISLSRAPLNFMIYFGLLILFGTIISSISFLFKYLFYEITPGFTSIMLAVFFFGSISVLMLGLIGRYLSSIYTEVRRRPLFLIQQECNFNKNKNGDE